MRTSAAIAGALAAVLAPGAAPAQEKAPPDPGYCQYVEGVAGAESALLVAPDLFTSIGVINVGQGEGDVPLGEPKGRFMLGIEYDFIDLWKGLELRERAETECRRYRAQSALEAAGRAGADVGAAPAFAARAEVLAASLPVAEKLLASLRDDMREARATLDEVDVVRLRLDELRQEARGAALAQERVQALPHGEVGTLVEVIAAFREADAKVEEIEGGMRALDAWSLELRGGYDEIIGVDQDLPVFGLLTLTFDLGGFWVGGNNSRAAAGRKRWVEEDVMSADRRVSELIGQLRSVRMAEQARLEEVTLLANDLARQLDEVRVLGTARVRRYETFLFFEITRLRGEKAYLETHLAEIDRILGAVEP